jgi:hypothetical protein
MRGARPPRRSARGGGGKPGPEQCQHYSVAGRLLCSLIHFSGVDSGTLPKKAEQFKSDPLEGGQNKFNPGNHDCLMIDAPASGQKLAFNFQASH